MRDRLCFWVITDHPSDFPAHICMRRQYAGADGVIHDRIAGLYDSLDDARADVPDGLCCIGRWTEDDPVIVESWC